MSITDTLGVYPEREYSASSDAARCFMFYDWEKPIGPEWLDLATEIFSEFGQTISQGTGNLGDKHSHGQFSRVRKKLVGFLDDVKKNPNSHFDIRLRSSAHTQTDDFFPCDLEMVLAAQDSRCKDGAIAVRETLVRGCASLVERIAPKVSHATGVAYAHVFDFPTLFGPASYLASIGAIPRGMSSLINKEYRARITRWRDNRWKGFLTNQGYLREVYPINYVLDAHLSMPFRNRPLSEYMKSVGDLKVTEYHDKIYSWTVPADRLDRVRIELEPSGLILSSPTTPPIQRV